MKKILKKTLKNTFFILFSFQLLIVVVLGILIIVLNQSHGNLVKSQENQYESFKLADQLRQSSDDLTRMVRTYVATGNSEFEREYWAVLDIRNGKIPQPIDYNNIYWDFVSATGQKPRADGIVVSLQDLMKKQGFTETEFAELDLAQKNSDSLVHAEIIAMNAMKGLFEDEQGNFTIKKELDQKMASELVNNEAYHKAKAEIMGPIYDFNKMFQGRTALDVNKSSALVSVLLKIIIGIIVFIFLALLYSFFIVIKQISEKELADSKLIEFSKDLENKVQQRTEKISESEAALKEALMRSNEMNKIMTNRELKMVELKKEIEELKKKIK